MGQKASAEKNIVLHAGEGRTYHCGPMTAIFKADEEETSNRYSISEWWVEPNSAGPGPHMDDRDDEIFYVLEGSVSFFLADKWIEVEKGSFIRVSPNTMHTFANNTDQKVGMLSFKVPGGFERNLPAMEKWFQHNPDK